MIEKRDKVIKISERVLTKVLVYELTVLHIIWQNFITSQKCGMSELTSKRQN